jgi:PST family polysaccharide transporter
MQAYDGLALMVFSFSAMCFALAKPIVLVILGPKWTGVIPLLMAFAIIGVTWPLAEICAWLYESQGRGKDQLRNHALAGLVTVIAYSIGLHWGPLGVVAANAVMGILVRLPIVYFIAGRRGPVCTSDMWLGFVSHVPCWVAVYLATAGIYQTMVHVNPFIQLLVCAPVGLGVGTVLMLLFPRPRRSALFAGSKIMGAWKVRFAPA